MSESLAEILSGAAASADSKTPANALGAKAAEAKAEPAKDVKPDEAAPAKADAKPAASATSAEQAKADASPDAKAAAKPADKATEESKEPLQARDEKGRFKSVEELQTELAAMKAATKDERTKRQALERRLQDMQKPKDEKPKTDFWTDPDAAIEERLTEREQALRRESEARFFNLCEDAAREKHADYDELVSELIEETDADQSLAQQVFTAARAAKNPALYLYKTASNRREMKAVGGDLAKYKESVAEPFKKQVVERDQEITALKAEVKTLKDQLDKIGKIPASLNAEPSASRGAVASEAVEPESLAEIVKPRKRRA